MFGKQDYDPNSPEAQAMKSQVLGVAHVMASPTNPRKTFDAAKHADMVDSVTRHGVLQPILVRPWPQHYPYQGDIMPMWEIIAGERRWRAAKDAGRTIMPGIVRYLDDREVLEIQVIENLQRDDLHPLEEAESYDLMMRTHGYSADELAEKIGKSREYIYGRLKLISLCPEARTPFREGIVSSSVALLVARIPSPTFQQAAMDHIVAPWGREDNGPLTYKAAHQYVQGKYMLKMSTAPFATDCPDLLASAGACTTCPKRTGADPVIFADVSADMCTDPECWADKKHAQVMRKLIEAKETGQKVITGAAAKKLAPYGMQSTLTGYLRLDEKNYQAQGDNWGKTTRELLGERIPTITLIEDLDKGVLVECIKIEALREALKGTGVRVSSNTPSRSPDDIRAEKEAKAESVFRRRLLKTIHTEQRQAAANSHGELGEADMKLVARQFWARIGSDSQKRLAAMWAEDGTVGSAGADPVVQITEWIDIMTEADLVVLLTDCALVGMTDCPSYARDFSTPSQLLSAARRLSVDPAAIRAEIEAGKKPKTGTKSSEKTAFDPTPAARAGDVKGASEGLEAAAPVSQPQPAAKAARAAKTKAPAEKPKVKAAGAARTAKEKALKSGRASPSRGTKNPRTADEDAGAPARDDKTVDMFVEGAA